MGEFPPTLRVANVTWLMARAVVSLEEAQKWLDEVQARVGAASNQDASCVLPSLGPVPELSAELRAPMALIRALPNTDSAVGSLISGLSRPAQALLWSSKRKLRFPEPQTVEVEGQDSFLPARDITGIHITPETVEPRLQTPVGLLVGRAERRAWIRTSLGSRDLDQYLIDLGWEPRRISLTDLELTHEEFLDGELVSSARLRLEDLDTTAVDSLGTCSVSMPSCGSSIAHGLSLHTLDGELLDRSGPYPLFEHIHVSVKETRTPPLSVEGPPAVPDLDDRLARIEQVTQDIQHTVRNGVQARMIADRQAALERLVQLIQSARGELLVLDRYFGQKAEEWRLLDDVSVPVRVLTAKLERDVAPRIAPHVNARYRPKAPLHERVWLWRGGGLAVGGSPTTFGQGPVRMTRLRTAEVDEWRAIFEAEWQSPLYCDVQRQTLDGNVESACTRPRSG